MKCKTCKGTGVFNTVAYPYRLTCHHCDGTGTLFQLEQPKRESKPIGENVKTVQKPLFIGADDLAGQQYLF